MAGSKRVLLKVFVWIGLLMFLGMYFAHKIDLSTADLGRHITNGRLFIEEGKIVEDNHYSYTMPDKDVVNHHWLSGVVFYMVWKEFGFVGLSVMGLVLGLMSFSLFFYVGSRRNFVLASLVAVLVMPLVGSRVEIRPELFSFLFLGFYVVVLDRYVEKGDVRFLWVLPIVQLLWVNLHLFFFMGIGLVALYAVFYGRRFKLLWGMLVMVVLSSLVNPRFISGFLEPFRIFGNYGYDLVENKDLFFLLRFFEWSPMFVWVLILSCVIGLVGVYGIRNRDLRFVSVVLIGSVLVAVYMRRLWVVEGYVSIAYVPVVLRELWLRIDRSIRVGLSVFVSLFVVGGSLVLPVYGVSPVYGMDMGFGLRDGSLDSLRFFKEAGLHGPIFNNYDIGGYLIYGLYPDEKVFVDNRPEAYSVEFFDAYRNMQLDGDVWKKVSGRYGFSVIYFYRRDLTNWGQKFLIDRVRDDEWVPVYVDRFVILFVKNSDEFKSVIDRYGIDRNRFLLVK